MSRRADPENIYLARRAAVLSILTTSGVSSDRAEAIVRGWEADAEARGIPRLERTFWEGAAEWTDKRARPNTVRASCGPVLNVVSACADAPTQGRQQVLSRMLHVPDPIIRHAGGDARICPLDAEPFGRWLRWQLKLRRMSQRQLAARSGVNHSTISRLIASDRQPSLATATKIARVLDDTGDAALIGRQGAPSSPTADPVARVERALRADEGLSEAQVRRLMFQYLSERQSVARRDNPARATPTLGRGAR